MTDKWIKLNIPENRQMSKKEYKSVNNYLRECARRIQQNIGKDKTKIQI